jgi:hypothetical protein
MAKDMPSPKMDNIAISRVEWYKNPLLLREFLVISCILVISEVLIFIVFIFIKHAQWIWVIIPEILVFLFCLLWFITAFRNPEFVGIGKNLIIFKDKWKREKIIRWQEIQTIDKVRFESDGFRSWAIILKDYKEPKPDGDKVTLGFISKDIINKIQEAFLQYQKEYKDN